MPVHHTIAFGEFDFHQTTTAWTARTGSAVRFIGRTVGRTQQPAPGVVKKLTFLVIHFHGYMATAVQIGVHLPFIANGKCTAELTCVVHIKGYGAATIDQVSAGAVAPVRRAALAAPPSPLAQLNRELAARAQADEDRARIEGSASVAGLKSVRQFSEVWSRIAAQDQVLQALEQGPENAGPLNPHRLMLRSLSLMRSLSPDYLRRFLLQMDSLLWLEQAASRPQRALLRTGRRAR